MSNTSQSKIHLSQKQMEILKKIVSEQPNTNKMEYQKIRNQFNEAGRKTISGFKPKSKKAIQGKVKYICNIEKHQWNFTLDQIMLNEVACNCKWKQIAKMPKFKSLGIISRDIKRKFQCGIRNKFVSLYREIYPKKSPPQISDLIYKSLMQQQKIIKYYQQKVIDKCQKQCLISNIRLFTTSLYEDETKLKIRSSSNKNRVLSLISSAQDLKLLVDSIQKLHDLKKNKVVEIEKILQNEITHASKLKPASPDLFSSLSQQLEPEVEIRQIDQQIQFQDYDDEIQFQVKDKLLYFNEQSFLGEPEEY